MQMNWWSATVSVKNYRHLCFSDEALPESRRGLFFDSRCRSRNNWRHVTAIAKASVSRQWTEINHRKSTVVCQLTQAQYIHTAFYIAVYLKLSWQQWVNYVSITTRYKICNIITSWSNKTLKLYNTKWKFNIPCKQSSYQWQLQINS